MQELKRQKMPTGIKSLDPILGGGVPAGSVILLLGDLGAGNYEFVVLYSQKENQGKRLDPCRFYMACTEEFCALLTNK